MAIKIQIPVYINMDDSLRAYAADQGITPAEAYRMRNCEEHFKKTGQVVNAKDVIVGDVVKIIRTVDQTITSGEGLDSSGSDYWLHRDVMDSDD